MGPSGAAESTRKLRSGSLTREPLGAILSGPIGRQEDIRQPGRTHNGGLAQLVERLNGIQEVRGSTPLSSTTHRPARISAPAGSFCLRLTG